MADIKPIKLNQRNGNDVPPRFVEFPGIDITNSLFYYERRYSLGREVVKKSLGNGLSKLNANTLLIDSYKETGSVGLHTAYLTCKDADGTLTFMKFEIIVEPKVTVEA